MHWEAGIHRTVKRLLAILTCLFGLYLLLLAVALDDWIVRALAILAAGCFLISGGLRFWLLRNVRKRSKWDEMY